MNPFQKILDHKIIVSLTVLGGIIFTLWDPLTSIFYTGYFHTNIVLDLRTENIYLDKNKELLVIHIMPTNKGNVPITIKDKNSFKLEIREIDQPEKLKWIEPSQLKLISNIDVLRNIVQGKNDSYTLEPSGAYEEVESITLPAGIYWINTTIEYNGAYFNQADVVKIPSSKNEK